MAKKNEVVKRTPEMLAKAQERMITIDSDIENHLNGINKGYLSIAPLIAEVYDNDYYVVKGYKNIDDYAKAEHEMSHGTVSGLRKVFDRFGSSKENEDGTKTYTIPEKYTAWGYTKLLLIASDEQKFKDAGIEPFEVFTSDMTIKAMKETLALKLEDKAKDQDENAIDTTAKEVDNNTTATSEADNASATAEADNASATATAESREETFKAYHTELLRQATDLAAFLSKEPKEVYQVADTIVGYIKTLEKTYNKAHATATIKDTKKNK